MTRLSDVLAKFSTVTIKPKKLLLTVRNTGCSGDSSPVTVSLAMHVADIKLTLIASVLLIIQNCFANESDLTGSCLIELQQYLYCVKQEVRYHAKIIGAEVTPSFKAKVDECFQKQSCPIPSKQSTIESQFKGKDLEVWTTFRRYIEALPTPKRQCAVRAIGDSYRNIFVECVNRFAPGVTARPLKDEIELPQEVLKLLNERAYWRTLVSNSFRDCPEHEAAAACVIGLRRTEFPHSCAIRNHCAVIDDDAGFNDCFTSCHTVSPKCKEILVNMRDGVCSCQIEKRKHLLTVGQRNANSTFSIKATKLAKILLNGQEKSDPLSVDLINCGLNIPLLKSKSNISYELARYILLYIDGYTTRDIVYCHKCAGQSI